ncbi:MAG: tRNA-dihydrouridine synthase family protein [Polyangiaceae bacterium]
MGQARGVAVNPKLLPPAHHAAHERLPWRNVLAPMEGVGHPAFRHALAAEGGLDLVCTEFVRVTSSRLNPEVIRRAIQPSPGIALSVQVMGNDADRMAEAARYVSEAGAAVIDVNLGCPMPRIVKKGVGAAMLKQPELLFEVLSQMREATPGLLSAKIRAGFDDAEHVLEIAETVQRAGVDFISVHPRRRADFYSGVADWRIVGLLAEQLSVPVIGNGDLWYAESALHLQAETGCAAVMIGRPAIRNPWIFRQLAELRAGEAAFDPTPLDVLDYVHRTVDRYVPVFHHVRGQGVLGKLKELCTFISRGILDGAMFLQEIRRTQSLDEFRRVSERHLTALPPEHLDLAASPRHGFERVGTAHGGTAKSGFTRTPSELSHSPFP